MLSNCKKNNPGQIGSNRLVISGDPRENWYIGWSPTNETLCAEGSWEEWVLLAKEILAEEKRRKQPHLDSIDSTPTKLAEIQK